MKSIITINFKKINNVKVDEKMLKEKPQLFKITKNVIITLCEKLTEYFKDHHIKVGTSFELK
jgi:hypothetical protein